MRQIEGLKLAAILYDPQTSLSIIFSEYSYKIVQMVFLIFSLKVNYLSVLVEFVLFIHYSVQTFLKFNCYKV